MSRKVTECECLILVIDNYNWRLKTVIRRFFVKGIILKANVSSFEILYESVIQSS